MLASKAEMVCSHRPSSKTERSGSYRRLWHVAGPGLLLWYLLTPPYVGPQKFDSGKPLTQWYEAVDFDSLHDCQRFRTGTIEQYRKNRLKLPPSQVKANVLMFQESQCVSSEDARRNGM